ncbi:MAG TPA: methyltransferase domain-containing protein [Methanocella sp.]|nr:methyltransferase domain-containing protein [Methanocella sp.]
MTEKSESQIRDESRKSFDQQALNYESSLAGKHSIPLYEHVIKTMNRYEYNSVLDVGCGTGNLLAEISKRKQVSIAGIDLSENMIAMAKKRLGETSDVRNGDSEHLPWKDNLFDIVTCTDSFHHYPNPVAVLKEMRRVMRPSGKLVIADPWAPTPFRQIANILLPFRKSGDVKLYSEQEIKRLLTNSGFTIVSWEKIGISAFVLVATPE